MGHRMWALFIAGALVACGGACLAQDGDVLRVETKWLRVEVDATTGAVTGLAADPAGTGDFTHPVLAGAGDGGGLGIGPACRSADGEVVRAAPGEGFGIRPVSPNRVAVSGLGIGDGLSASLDIELAPDGPELNLRASVRAETDAACRWAGLLLALDPALAPSTVYFAGREGLASARPARLVTEPIFAAGAICKGGAERTFVVTTSPPRAAEIEVQAERSTIALAPVINPEPVTLRKGDAVNIEARVAFGLLQVPTLKRVTSKFQPLAQDFVLWTTHVATSRRFLVTEGEPAVGRWMQETAAVIDPGLPEGIQEAYRRCWLRDVAHGWKSAAPVAGPELLAVMRDEIVTFSDKLNEAGHPPTHIAPDGSAAYGNLDSAGLLIGMIYDYLCRTGDVAFVRGVLLQADRMGEAILGLLGPRDLPVIGEGGDTYPDLGFIKGEQTYLTAVCCDGLRKLARLHEVCGEAEPAGKLHAAANRIGAAANRTCDKGGLWDAERGVYVGWRNPDGSLYSNEESFANLWTMYGGVCDAPDRIRAIFAHLNSNWQRYYLDGLCPTAHSIEPYANGLNQWVPWVGGWDVYIRTKFSEPKAYDVWRLFLADYERTDFPYREASGYEQKEASVGNRGRIWDSWGFLQAVYAGHYGVEMAPSHLRILPRPLEYVPADGFSGLEWRQAAYDLSLRGRGLHLAQVTVDGKEWASCVFSKGAGKHAVEMTQSAGARKAFVMDAAPLVEVLAAEHRENGLRIEAAVPGPGRYWFVVQWPDLWGRMNPDEVRGAEFPQVARLTGERAAMIVSVGRAGKFSVTLGGSRLLMGK